MDPASTSSSRVKKKNGADQPVSEDIVPLPIQTFLWRQTRYYLQVDLFNLQSRSSKYVRGLRRRSRRKKTKTRRLDNII